MATGKRHPHVAMPSDDDLRDVIGRLRPQHEALYLAVHALVVGTVPDARFEVDLVDGSIGYGAWQYGYGGWGMAALQAHKGWVSLFFMEGVEMHQPAPDERVREDGVPERRETRVRPRGGASWA